MHSAQPLNASFLDELYRVARKLGPIYIYVIIYILSALFKLDIDDITINEISV